MTNWPLCASVRGTFSPPIGRYPDTLIDYQAERNRNPALLALGLRALDPGAIFRQVAKPLGLDA